MSWAAAPGIGICTDAYQYEALIGSVKEHWEFELMTAAFMGFFNQITYIGQTLAHDTAVWVANGGKGQAPMFWEKGFGDYMNQILLDSVGEFMLTLSEESFLADLGLNLCKPPNFPELALEFALSIPEIAVPGIPRPTPRCPWNQFRDNWKEAASSMSNVETLGNIRGTFTTGGNDIAFGIGAHMALFDAIAEHREAGILERLEGGGFKPVEDYVTGNIKTPASVVEANLNQQLIYGPADKENVGLLTIGVNAFELGFVQLGKIMLSTFVNTLVSTLMQNIMKGILPTGGGGGAGGLPNLLSPFAAPTEVTHREEIMADQFREILTPKISVAEEEDILVELEGCSDAGRNKWNCAISGSMAQGLRTGPMTLRQAIDRGYVDETFKLIPSTELKDNQDIGCANRAFCVANLRKLRLARVIPIGWELAADSPYNQMNCSRSEGCVTLGEAMNGFDDCNYDVANGGSREGVLDGAHPWCHLIDPNWVLAIMPAQCLTKGFGNDLYPGSSVRSEECQDTVMCLERDKNGKCTGGYGYCMAEQTFWQFEALSCDEQYVSCRTYTPRGANAKPIGYLRSTLDYGSCDETNVGCMWYATRIDPSATDATAWTAEYAGTLDKVYFDKTMLPCDASNDGCTDLRRVEPGEPALNLIKNPSFEFVDGDGNIEDWLRYGEFTDTYDPYAYIEPEPLEGARAYAGSRSLIPPASGSPIAQFVSAKAGHQYTVSFYTRRYASSIGSSDHVRISFFGGEDDVSALPVSLNEREMFFGNGFHSDGCDLVSWGDVDAILLPVPPSVGSEWERVNCSFVAPPGVAWMSVSIQARDSGALLDAVKLEESEIPTAYNEGLNENLASVHMRVPPEELMCTGDSEQDHPLCDSYARVCRQNEADCQGYRPLNRPSTPEVPAVLSPADYCPEECVGYAEFRKQASTFDFVRNPQVPEIDDPTDETIATFIPSTARVCLAQDVGCELFTNLETLETGGESAEAYSYLRSCEKPGQDAQTFYTWEGSEDSGYQLVTWSLVKDTAAALPQGPLVLHKAGPDGFIKESDSCNAVNYLLAFDPDCRQFYDPQGNVFYRYESQTVLSDTDCAQYRLDGSGEADCTKTGGTFNASTNQCVYRALGEKSNSCDASVAGCRGYVGTQGGAQMEVFNEEFTDEEYALESTSFGLELTLSEESVLVGDTSLRVFADGDLRFSVPTEPGVLYELYFWGKYAGSPPFPVIAVNASDGMSANVIGSAPLTNAWNVYRIGPFLGDSASAATRISLNGFRGVAFIDKVRVERITDVTYAIKDSWNTPAICDRTVEGIPLPQAMIGCQTYTDRNQQQVNLRQFTRLCRESAIGCKAYINTENTLTPYMQTWEREGANRTEITRKRADHYDYYIEDAGKACPESQKGCRAFGLPQFTQDRLALKGTGADAEEGDAPFETVYLRDDATLYDEALCSEPELFCESYAYSTADQSGTSYFRAPGDHACEWREGVVVDQSCDLERPDLYLNTTYDGWFKVGTDCPCYEDRLMRGSAFGLYYTGDPGYNGWYGADQSLYDGTYQAWSATCPEAHAECTEFRDVSDQSDPAHPLGRPYFVINDQRLDKESCGGQVNPGDGCVLFRDTSDSRLSYSSLATQDSYTEHGYASVDPIDCEARPDHPSCIAATEKAIFDLAETAYIESRSVRECVGLSINRGDQEVINCTTPANDPERGPIMDILQEQGIPNDTNIVVKVKPDRSCSQWLACETGETVYDPQTGSYKSICSELALCNEAGGSEGPGVPYCTNFVNRSREEGIDTILKRYQVVDAQTYANREIGFGSVDYSGFTMADKFQVIDTSLKAVGSILTQDPAIRSAYKKDYRLGVAVDMDAFDALVSNPSDNDGALEIMANTPELKPYTCIFNQTGALGLMTSGDRLSTNGDVCWLSVDQAPPPQMAGAGAAIVTDNMNVANLTTRFAQDEFPQMDQQLSRSFPNTQCKAAPESTAPFGNEFVIEWDDSVRPPEPSRAVSGYASANFCEYGEECACVYKRVQYGAYTKYYEPLSTDVVNAICMGGYRDGLPCVPNAGIEGSQRVTVNVSAPAGDESDAADGGADSSVSFGNETPADNDQRCGEGGTCIPISDVSLVRGITGQCLEYDMSRVRAGDQTQNECLTWNPNPVLSGPGDQYHWHPTAGFQPPQSSGRYYCSSAVRDPRSEQFKAAAWLPKEMPDEGFDWSDVGLNFVPGLGAAMATYGTYEQGRDIYNWGGADSIGGSQSCGDDDKFRCYAPFGPIMNSEGNYMGRISALFYADWYTSDGSCTNFVFFEGCTGNEGGASLDGHKADGTTAGDRCEKIDDEDGHGFVADRNLMRLVTTGQGTNRSYAEYALLFNPWDVAYTALGFYPTDWNAAFDYSLEDSIANFEFSVPKGKIGCAYNEEWGDVHVKDYNSAKNDGWGDKDNTWHANFSRALAEGGGTLNRSTAQIVTEDGSPSGIPVKVECFVGGDDDSVDNRGAEDGLCYLKTWELNWNAEGQLKFQAFGPDIGRNDMDHLSRRPVYGKCDSSKHWFSIRAVFEDTNAAENALAPEEANPDQLVGPFQFVGLWVTTCAPGGQTKYIYMDMKMNSADICRELVETVSKDSHDVVAFTDRNQSNSGYSMDNAFSWYTANVPFGASLATGDAGIQPLFMTGVRQQDVNPMNPPTFTGPGQTYFSAAEYPTSNWGRLSNVFAKIYRIYGYDARGVSRTDWACTDDRSPQFGQWCPPGGDPEVSRDFCGFEGKCLRGGVSGTDVFSTKVCNVFSGVNRGLDCTADPDICHKAAMQEQNGVLAPMYGSCALFTGYTDSDPDRSIDQVWEEVTVSGKYRCRGEDCDLICRANEGPGSDSGGTETGCTRAEAIKHGAFRCAVGTVRGPDKVPDYANGERTYASFCTRESDKSNECPQEVANSTCINIRPSGIPGLGDVGTCAGRPWAQCTRNEDCGFSARNFWPSGTVNDTFLWSYYADYLEDQGMGDMLGQWNRKFEGREEYPWRYANDGDHALHDAGFFYATADFDEEGESLGNSSFRTYEGQQDALAAFWPAVAYDACLGSDTDPEDSPTECGDDDWAYKLDEYTPFWPTWIKPGSRRLTYADWDDTTLLKLYPGFNPFIYYRNSGVEGFFCSKNVETRGCYDDQALGARAYEDDNGGMPPYLGWDRREHFERDRETMYAQYGACESLALMFRDLGSCNNDNVCVNGPNAGRECQFDSDCSGGGAVLGTCSGGGRDGESCNNDVDCRPAGMSNFDALQDAAGTWCNPVTTGRGASPSESYLRPLNQAGIPAATNESGVADDCWPASCDINNPNHPQRESDTALDCNICTHPPGYWPRPQWCEDPNDEYCGLFGYYLANAADSVQDERPLPTDVTQGLYSPIELNPGGVPNTVSENTLDYKYLDRYAPEPPQVAAPDLRTCQGTQCRVSGLGTFAMNGLAGGLVNGGVGNHVASMRFYAWASHNQMPLRRIMIDWGDGNVTEVPDAYMKNRKPYCQTPKECTETPGLTCQTDADCPPGGGICVTWGNCSNNPNRKCYNDLGCGESGGFCESRVYFGNDQDACEENFFEFRHAYSCPTDVADSGLPSCGDTRVRRCTSDWNRTCNGTADCEPGDACVESLAPPSDQASEVGGCYDASNNRCMYTPRVMVVDNWGWCSGECRNSLDQNGNLVDRPSGADQFILHPNGGCYDGTGIMSNNGGGYQGKIMSQNECAFDPAVSTQRPWIVFPGSLQLLPGIEL